MGTRMETWCDRCGRDTTRSNFDLWDFVWGLPTEVAQDKYRVGLCEPCKDELTSKIDAEMKFRNGPIRMSRKKLDEKWEENEKKWMAEWKAGVEK